MKNRPTRLLPAICALLAIGVGVAAWYFLRATPAPDANVVNADDARAAVSDRPDAGRPRLSPPAAETPAEESAATAKADERKNVATPAELELAEALWMRGRLVFPEGTPVGEQVDVIASGRKFKTRPPYRARVEPSGNFRVAFAAGTKNGTLEIDAPHLFLSEKLSVKPADAKRSGELLLEPRVGGCIRGRMLLPAGSEAFAAELAGKTVSIEGWSENYDDHASRSAALDAGLRFELRGLPPKCAFELGFKSDAFVTLAESDLHVESGLNLEREFQLTLGARVRGRVSDASGQLPESRTLMVASIGPDEDSSDAVNETVELEPDGHFDARGIRPGKVGLFATASQRLPAKLDVGELADGDVREGIELVFQPGARLAGRVSWPDGSPAVDARVQVQKLVEDNEFAPDGEPYLADAVLVRTNATGEFTIAGLDLAKYTVTAVAKPAADPTSARGSKGRPQAWRARLENVAADTLDLDLKLQGGSAIHGLAVDDVGTPLTRFSVSASLRGKTASGLPDSAHSLYSSADGRFELGGLQEAVYGVSVSASAHDESETIEITLPAESDTFTFVARRRASLSGVVLRPDGTPAARADVFVGEDAGPSGASADSRANARGEFSLKSAPTGSVHLRARLDGFASSEGWSAVLAPGASLANVRLMLRAGGTISGEIHALRAGEVLAERSIQGRGTSDEWACSATTNASGHFVIEHVDPGEFDLTLEASQAQVAALTGSESDSDWELRRELERHARASVSDGVTTHVTFGAPAHAAVLLSGSVRRGDTPQASVRVRCERLGDEAEKEIQYALSDSGGHYELSLDGTGYYLVQAMPSGSDGTRIGRKVEVPANGLRGVDLSISSGRISGVVVGPDGAEVDWADARLVCRGGSPGVEEVQCEDARPYSQGFDFRDLPAGKYRLEVTARGGLDRARRRDADSSEPARLCKVRREISLGEGEQLTDLKIELQQAATLTIQVQYADGTRPAGAWIDLRPANRAGETPTWQYSSEGVFEADQLEPGVYDMRAYCKEQISAWTSRVEIDSGQARELTLVLQPAGQLSFEVKDNRGETVAASVQVYDESGRALLSDPVASFEAAGPFAPGMHRVVATDSKGHRAEAKSEVLAGQTLEVSLSFP